MKKKQNISAQAYDHIRETLLKSSVYVGQKISHQELGKNLNISYTPVREALFRLAAEGLLLHENNKGFSIPAITLEEATEIYEVREIVEPYLVEKAAKKMTPSRVKEFQNILASYKKNAESYHRIRLQKDRNFHMKIAQTVGNSTLTQLLNQMYDKLMFKSPMEHISKERRKEALAEHIEVLEMLKRKDGKKAARLMRKHIRVQRDYVLHNIKEREENTPTLSPIS